MRRVAWLALAVATAAWAATVPLGIQLPTAEGMAPLREAGDVVAIDGSGQLLASSNGEWVKLPDLAAWLGVRPAAAVSRLVVDRRTPFLPVRDAIAAMVNSGRKWLQFAGEAGEGLEIVQDVAMEVESGELRAFVPLTVHLRADGIWVARSAQMGVLIRAPASTPAALETLRSLVELDQRLNPAAGLALINTDDDVPFGHTFVVIGVVQSRGLDQVLLAGGPRAGDLHGAIIPAPPPGPPARPKKVGVLPTGRIIIDGTRVVDATADLRFWEDCAGEQCTVMLEQPPGQLTVLGTRPHAPGDRTRRWIFGHEVHAAPGLAGSGPHVTLTGELPALPQMGGDPSASAGAESGDSGPHAAVLLGTLAKEVIDRTIRTAAVPLVQDCYQQLLGRSPDAAGKASVRFVIGPEGKVTRAEFATVELGDVEFHECMLGAIRAATFPPPRGGGMVIVTYPFVLTSR